jgi:hypothetical protein
MARQALPALRAAVEGVCAHLEAKGDVGAGDTASSRVSRCAVAHHDDEREHAAREAEVQEALPREARVRRRRHGRQARAMRLARSC